MSHENAITLPTPDYILDATRSSWRHSASYLWQTAKSYLKQPFYSLYLHRLRGKAHTWGLPRHMGVIMDGNRRWARGLGFANTLVGHRHGADKLHEVLNWCFQYGIEVVTVWCFSLDNFHRNPQEVQGLLELFEEKTREMLTDPRIHNEQVRVRFIGRIDLLPETLQAEIRKVEEATAHYRRLELNVAMAYGGRDEIADAAKRYVAARAAAGATIEEILEDFDAESIDRSLYTAGQPEPDLILRTSGEVRLSGFLLWQSANSEFYFCDTNWPAFREIDFLRALRAYHDRQRRFGR